MKLSPRERAMLREMGVAWPDPLALAHEQADVGEAPMAARSAEPVAPPSSAQAAAAPAGTLTPAAAPSVAVQARPVRPQPPGEPWPVQPDWEELKAAVAACRRCGLCENRRHTVFGVGDPRAGWMVVGEAPGEQEDRQAEPFVGAAGQLLDRMLASIGLSRDAKQMSADPAGPGDGAGLGEGPVQPVFITNTVKCRPPQNRNPEAPELDACAPVLQRQIELVRPRLVLAMGRFAAQALLRTEEPIGRLRGRVHRLAGEEGSWAGRKGVPVVVTYHPAYLLRNPIDKAKAWDDLCLALDTMQALSKGEP